VIQIYTSFTGKKTAQQIMFVLQKENSMMKTIKTAAVAVVLSALSFGVFAAQPATSASQSNTNITNIEAGSNMVPVAQSTHGTNDQAFDAHTLVAGEWN
jgi:squalene cyclase